MARTTIGVIDLQVKFKYNDVGVDYEWIYSRNV